MKSLKLRPDEAAVDRTRWEAAEWEEAARAILSQPSYDFYAGAAGREQTLRANEKAWAELFLRPHVLAGVNDSRIGTTILGSEVATPIGVAPTAYQSLAHVEGEIAMVKGIQSAGALMTVSSRASASLDSIGVSAKAMPWWFQVYVLRDRSITEAMVHDACVNGAKALVFTVDAPVLGKRLRDIHNNFLSPASLSSKGWANRAEIIGSDFEQDPNITFSDIEWLMSICDLPVVVKGIVRGDDACQALDAGAAAIWVSNHGGRQLDGAVTTVDALQDVKASVADSVEVYVDGGIRTGIDVLRAMCLGAHAVFVGRPAIWALSVGGAQGVFELLQMLSTELARSMQLCGLNDLSDASSDLLAK